MNGILTIWTQMQEYFPIIAILSIFIEVSPIKINPVSLLLTWSGKTINRELFSKLEDLSKRVDENEMDRLRCEILDFGNACRNGRKHYKDEFEHIISSNTKYHDILKKYNLKNGILDMEYQHIQKIYQKCLESNDFL